MAEQQDLFSVFDIAKRLKLHVKTVRNYVREGRLKAVRIGKQYRIARSDLEAFTGFPLPLTDSERAKRHRDLRASCVVEIDAISPETATRLTNSLVAVANSRGATDEPLRVETIYDETRGRMRVILVGSMEMNASLFKIISALLER